MNAEKMGICVSMIVLVAVLGVAVVASGEFDLGIDEIKIPQITSSTNTDIQKNTFYEWCYKMNLEC